MRKQKGFTLVELVVVVMILGILAAVAAPKLLGTSSVASDNGVKQTLAIVRDAIERYAADNGGKLPGADGDSDIFHDELKKYLRGEFPTCPVAGKNNVVKFSATPVGFAGEAGESQTESWHYCQEDGQFIVNSSEPTINKNDAPGLTYDQL
jgi:prepilin-type N-terminal cleavage/methylation domain-containing protein